jgi:Glyoxalase-like domain
VRWITASVDLPPDRADVGVAFWRAVTSTDLSSRRGACDESATLLPPDGDAYLRVQTLEQQHEPAGRVHLDLHFDDVHTVMRRAAELGAVVGRTGGDVVMLTSPGGLPFCIRAHDGAAVRPPPLRLDAGHRSLVDQVCIDIPPRSWPHECGFWRDLTGWELRQGSRPEFRYLARPANMPLRLLLQRLDADPNDGRVQAHLDLACDDVDAEVARHGRLGARLVAVQTGWVVMVDPAGAHYCITSRDPMTGTTARP